MFFVLSKVLGFMAVPSNFLAVATLAGAALLLTRWQRLARHLLVGGVLAIAVLGFSPLSNVLLLSLSERFPPWDARRGAPYAIVVLGGAIDPDVSAARNAIELDSSSERALALLTLARRFPDARVVFSGGSGSLAGGLAETTAARKLLAEFDLTGNRFIFEDASRTTLENATQTFRLLSPKPGQRFLLVTSSFHMPRAMGVFRSAGFEVEAYPVDWRTRGPQDALQPFHRLSAGLARADVAIHEWTGLIIYRLTGRTSSLYPEP
jgi:uncharacterized SAM-binding protein YcdF (DUF218 family)